MQDPQSLMQCPHCRDEFVFDAELIGRKVCCSSCNQVFIGPATPGLGTPLTEAAAPESAVPTISCPYCQIEFALFDEELIGRKIRCSSCNQALLAPAAPGPAEPFAVPAGIPEPAEPEPTPPRKWKWAIGGAAALLLLAGGLGTALFFTPSIRHGGKPTAQVPAKVRLPVFPKSAKPPPAGPVALRADNYEDALALAKTGDKDIVVFQRGSDWNRLGEAIYQGIWQTDDFACEVGDQFVLLAIDRQEVLGATPLPPVYRDENGAIVIPDDKSDKANPSELLTKLADEKSRPPVSDLQSVTSESKALFTKRADGTFAVDGISTGPNQDVFEIKLKAKTGGRFLRLDFPTDPSLPSQGPGLPGNGNSIIGEMEIFVDLRKVKPEIVECVSQSNGGRIATTLFDGVKVQGDPNWEAENSGWELGGGKPAALLLALPEAIPANTEFAIRIYAKSKWGQHVPGCFRAAVLADKPSLKLPAPENEITAVVSEQKMPFVKRADGACLVKFAPNPAQDVFTLKIKPAQGGNLLRLDFPLDPDLPGNGPGRATNGNFAISEIETQLAGKPVKATAIWSSYNESTWYACNLIDGISDKVDNAWIGGGHQHKPRTLMLVLAEPVPANADLAVRVICKTQWGQHVPGSCRAAILADPGLVETISRISAAQALSIKNRKFDWQDNTYCPRVAMLDSKGRGYACFNNPRLDLTRESLAEKIRQMQGVRIRRDALWAKADKAAGMERAELLRQGVATMLTEIGSTVGYGVWKGNGNCYQPIWNDIAKIDPKDDSWITRWLNTGLDSRCGLPGMEEVGKLTGEKKFEEAIALVDKTLADPRMQLFDNDRKQRLMNTKFHIYRQWGSHAEQMAQVERDMAALDRTTYLGLGAWGDVVRHWQVPEPKSITYGWGHTQVKPGINKWDLDMGLDLFFPNPGHYKLRIRHNAGKDTVKVTALRLKDGTATLAESAPVAPLNEIGPGKVIELDWTLNPKQWNQARKLHLEMEVAADTGKTECGAGFEVEPILDETEFPGTIPAKCDMLALQRELAAKLLADPATAATDPAKARLLAKHELIRACGADALNELQSCPGGTTIIAKALADPEWIETLLTANAPAESHAKMMDNLRILNRYGENLDNPLYRRLMSAIALGAGKTSPYRQVESLRVTQQAHQDLLLHPGFDRLNVRDMRNAIQIGMATHEFNYLLNERQGTIGDGFGACNAIWYRMDNDFGTSIHGGGYHEPWNWCWPRYRIFRQVGGVCGTLSTYGAMVTRTHGIPAFTVGQPGHCAYVIRYGQEWPVGNSVTWPTYCGAPGWEGTGYSTFHRLYEPVIADGDKLLAANRLIWLARLQAAAAAPKISILPGLQYSQYKLPNAGLPDFTKLTPEKTGEAATISARAVMPAIAENIGIVWTGKIETAAGTFKIICHADDFGRVLIDGKEVVRSGNARAEKILPLTAGPHDFRVEYIQGTATYNLAVLLEGVAKPGDWCATAEMAIAAQPTNFGIWLDYIKMLEAAPEVPLPTWTDLGRQAAKTFALCNEAGWALVMRCLDKSLPSMTPVQRQDLLADCNCELRQEFWYRPEGYQIEGVFNWQVDRIGNNDLAIKLFSQMLSIHQSAKPENNWIFGQVMNWGTNRFANNKATSAGYAKAMDSFFSEQGAAADKNQMAGTITANIRKASETSDIQSYQLWTDMADRFLPALSPGEVHLNPDMAKNRPAITPFPGIVLSATGMLQSSSVCGSDRPRSYRAILSESSFGGFLDTNHEPKPWAQIQLLGPSEVSGIILVDRYEYTNPNDKGQQTELAWLPPFKVSISTDGKTWTEAATITTPSPSRIYRIDLGGKKATTQFIRVEHLPDPKADPKVSPGRLHLRHFLVYGKKLY